MHARDPLTPRQDFVRALDVHGNHWTTGACGQKPDSLFRLLQSHPIPACAFRKYQENLSLIEKAQTLSNSRMVHPPPADRKGMKPSDERTKKGPSKELLFRHAVKLPFYEGHANEQRIHITDVIGR
jgi:hypothetical protein